jgi:hypothetical protein
MGRGAAGRPVALAAVGLLALAGAGRPAAVAGTPVTEPGESLPQPPAALPHLTGIVIANGKRQAIFTGADGPSSATVTEGETIGACTVAAIAAGRVDLRCPSGTYFVSPMANPGFRAAMTALQPPSPSLVVLQQAQADNDK